MKLDRNLEDRGEVETITRTINVIAGGFVGGHTAKSVCKKHLQEVLSLSTTKMKKIHKPSSTPEIVFSSSDLEGVVPGHTTPWLFQL